MQPRRYRLAMAISESDIAAVRAATDIVALITEQVALKKTGRRWTGLCPFHGEKTPSFSVNAEEGRYYCFGCRVAGDQITWVRETMHLDFVDAVRLLADRASIELHEDANASKERKERQRLFEAMERAVDWYHHRLLEAPDARVARDYLRSRGISGEIARQFRLGWAPDQWDALVNATHFDEAVLTGTGLGFVNQRGRKQDAMRARLIFPIFDPSGKAIAMGGRIMPGATRPDGTPQAKYKNSPETPIYSKRRTLYALNWAKDDVIRTGEIIVCEGYTDVIAFFGAGMPRAVATCGTALGEEHFRAMRNFAKRIVLAYDADQAGQSAAASVYQWERQHEVDVAVARLPRGTDPAELAQRDPVALAQSVADAVPFLQFRLERVLELADFATPEGRARAGERAIEVLAEHPSELVRDQYVMQVADRLRLDVAMLRARVADVARGETRITPIVAPPRPAAGRLPRPGIEALRLCVHFADLRTRFDVAYFVHEVQRDAFSALTSGEPISSVIERLDHQGLEEAARVLSEVVVDDPGPRPTDAAIAAVVAQLLRHASDVALHELERELRSGTVAPEVAVTVIRDVKERLALLGSDQGESAEASLREWLAGRLAAQLT